jgi:hypothetical protein
MLKRTQVFDWEQEPVDDSPLELVPSGFYGNAEFAGRGAFEPKARAAALAPRKSLPMTPDAMRSPPNDTDKTISRLVPRWLEALPAESRPAYLCAHFPRIANRLALCWQDPILAARLLGDLLRDKRGNRRGFPPEALAELKSLRQVASRCVAEAATGIGC